MQNFFPADAVGDAAERHRGDGGHESVNQVQKRHRGRTETEGIGSDQQKGVTESPERQNSAEEKVQAQVNVQVFQAYAFVNVDFFTAAFADEKHDNQNR